MTRTYRLKIGLGNRQFEAEGDKKFVLDMWKKFQSNTGNIIEQSSSKNVEKGLSSQVMATSLKSKQISIGEFLMRLGFKKHTDTVLAFGYYLEKYAGMNEFNSADINKCYYEAKMESSNTTQMLTQNLKTARIMRAKDSKKKGQFVLTKTGESFIEKSLNKKKGL